MNGSRNEVMIRFKELTRCYGATVAVKDLNLAISAGEVFGLLGPNGAGKTTALKVAVGLLRPTRGTVEICGYDVQKEPRKVKAKLGFVPDVPLLADKLTAVEHLELVAALWSLERSQGERRARQLLELCGLADVGKDRIETYSKGMRKRLALASALIHDPQVLILDDPTTDLDPPTGRLVWELLGELARRGVTVLIATHILADAARFCDRVGMLHRGELIAEGSPQALLAAHREATLEDLFLKLVGGDMWHKIRSYLEKAGVELGESVKNERSNRHIDPA